VPDAGRIDRTTPGRAIVRIGADRPFPVQIAWSGAAEGAEGALRSRLLHEPHVLPATTPATHPSETPLERTVQTISAAALADGTAAPRRPWLEPLPDRLDGDQVPASERAGLLHVGVRDLPREQRQDALTVDLDRDGGVMVLGANRSGRTTTLVTIATAAVRHPVDAAHVYAIAVDDGLDTLLSHDGVGDVVRADEVERVSRLVRAVHTEVRRRRSGATGTRLLLLVDGFAPLEELHGRINRGELVEQLVQVARDGRSVGVHLVLAAHRRSEVPPSLAAALGCRIDLRFPTEDDAAMAGCPTSAADRDRPPGRCVVDGAEAHIAVFDRATALAAATPRTPPPPPVPALPDVVPLADLERSERRGPWDVPVGIDADTLSTVVLDLEHHHAIVAGPARSGRTTTLATVAASFASSYLISARALAVDASGESDAAAGAWRRAWHPPGAGDSLDSVVDAALGSAEHGRFTLLAVDDLPELLDGPDEAMVESLLLDVIERSRTLPIRVVASGEIDAMARCYGDLMSRLRSGRTGVLLRPDPDLHGGLLHATLSARDDLPPGAGRGWLISPASAQPIQVAAA
ncbi:MAG: FtsK/SpoIIIE domain-containing protein, partial [Actinomycetota bacterium]|nr:FtsK/SpoIIIE domain-containing protein [Actinomycetota bacterium]